MSNFCYHKRLALLVATILACVAFVFCSSTTAFALSSSYMQAESWKSIDIAQTKELDSSSADDTIKGTAQIIALYEENELYTYLNITETSIAKYGDRVKIVYFVVVDGCSYDFAVDKNGISEYSTTDVLDKFEVMQCFNKHGVSSGQYVAGIKLKGKSKMENVGVNINVNGNNYKVFRDVNPADYAQPTTTKQKKASNTTKQNNKKQTTVAPTKSTTLKHKITTKKLTKSGGVKTKAKVKISGYKSKNTPPAKATTLPANQGAASVAPAQNGSGISTKAKVLYGSSAGCAALGVALLFTLAVIPKAGKQKD